MSTPTFEKNLTGLLVVDPYNDFISEGGILWPLIKEIAETVNCVPNMLTTLQAARAAGIPVFFAPHHRDQGPEDESNTWKYIAPIQTWGHERHLFTAGSWGGTFRDEFTPLPGEIVAQEHWCSSGFANTDLDLQLKRHGVHKLIVIGLRANTCIDSTVRFAVELGYDVTLVKDATASYQWEEMKMTLEVNLPLYACHIISAADTIAALKQTAA
ncbi:nicotinamidase-related amidase [Silvibacterium bohemicum]|uniref:Nicotinamidase-related amidase n=1 Tax=Silvibacterium bohemicum TaxID=1577686 RepID=A0A841JXL5_9BACT|nr:isochorismatase family cysteine hydrolase [Silvibacterium bohemicum]MBB6144479.1 nicotinamidase-related amidase [Silvibacterium bohemicum]